MDGIGDRREAGRRADHDPRGDSVPDWLAALDAPPRAEEFELAFDSDLAEMLRVRILGSSRPTDCRGRRSRR